MSMFEHMVSNWLIGAKQKERMKQLERRAAIAVISTRAGSSVSSLDCNNLQLRPAAESLMHAGRPYPHGLTYAFICSCIRNLPTDGQRDTLLRVVRHERLNLRDIVKYGIISLGYAMDTTLYESSRHLSLTDWVEKVISAVGGIDILMVVCSGIRLISGLSTPAKMPKETILDVIQNRNSLNHIQLSQWSYGAAVIANAELINMPIDDFFDDDAVSPFLGLSERNLTVKETDGSERDAAFLNAMILAADNIEHDLRPTPIQLSMLHHPCYDVIPWPVFRSKLIMAISADPPLIDEEDFCMDLLHGGICCWGSTGPSMHGRGGGVPWDSRSWEAAPWFLRKWEVLTDGRNGDMWRTSEWWRCMRG